MKVLGLQTKQSSVKDTGSKTNFITTKPPNPFGKKTSGRPTGITHTSIIIPSGNADTPSMHFNIDTNVDIITTSSNSRASLVGYWLPCINTCTLVALLFISVSVVNALKSQVELLHNDVDRFYQEINLVTKNYNTLQLNFEELSRRFDYSNRKYKSGNVRFLVEREAVSTVSYDYTTEQLTDKNQVVDDSRVDSKLDLMPSSSDIRKTDKMLVKGDEHETLIENNSTEYYGQNREFAPGDFSTEDDYDDADYSSAGPNRAGRSKRSNGRGIQSAHFTGAFPEIVIRDGGSLIAPWFLDESAAGSFGLSRFNLREGKGAVEVTEAGLYYIYAQVYYLTNEPLNSFIIQLRQSDTSVIPLTLCGANAAVGTTKESSEVSCYTSVVRYLKPGEQIYLQQRERNRRIIMSDGHTFLGLVRLHSQKPAQRTSQ